MMRWLLTSRSADGTWRLPLLQFLLLIVLMLFILATLMVLASQREQQTVDLPGAQKQADAVPPQVMRQSTVTLPASTQNSCPEQPPASTRISRLVQPPARPAVSAARSQPIVAAAASAFKGTVTLSGGVRYFHGQTNQRGQILPLLPLAFLAGERINITMDFTAEPSSITIMLKDMTMTISGILGQTHYETWLLVPEWERTIDWNGDRVLPTLTMNVHASSRANPLVQTDIAIPGLDVGGSVYDILIMQIA